jgi:NADH:ubiquinone oxidoreductase subunit K
MLSRIYQGTILLSALFYYMAAASICSALLAVTRRNPVHSMLWVLALFLHVAGIYLLLGAEFLAAVQVIVYAGAILIFYLFVVMLLDLRDEISRPRFGSHWPFYWPVFCRHFAAYPRGHAWGSRRRRRKWFRFGDACGYWNRAVWSFCPAVRGRFSGTSCRHHRCCRAGQEDRRIMIVPIGVVLGLSAVLFGIGVFGFLARRNIILMLVSVEVMLNAVNLSLAGFSQYLSDVRGQIIALFVIAVAAAEAGVGLGLVIALNRNKPGAAVADLTRLKW